MFNRLPTRLHAALSLLSVLGVSAGCAVIPPRAAYIQSPQFEPASLERVSLAVRTDDRKGGARAVGAVESTLTAALMARGYSVVRSGDAGTSATPLSVSVDRGQPKRERREGTVTTWRNEKSYERTVYTTYYIERVTISAELLGADGVVLWASRHTATSESDDSTDAAQAAAVRSAAGMVGAALPYRRLPIDKKGKVYDPRVTAPSR